MSKLYVFITFSCMLFHGLLVAKTARNRQIKSKLLKKVKKTKQKKNKRIIRLDKVSGINCHPQKNRKSTSDLTTYIVLLLCILPEVLHFVFLTQFKKYHFIIKDICRIGLCYYHDSLKMQDVFRKSILTYDHHHLTSSQFIMEYLWRNALARNGSI